MPTTLETLEVHYDTSPRAGADTVEVGPFTVFLPRPGSPFPYYARPRLGLTGPVTAAQVAEVIRFQDEAGVPRALEWVTETTPGLLEAAREAGFTVALCPLLVLDPEVPVRPRTDRGVELLTGTDERLADVLDAVSAGFAGVEREVPGGEGPAGAPDNPASRDVSRERRRMADGLLGVAGAFLDGVAVGGGQHLPRGEATELVGIAVVPSARRRGLGAALAETLAADARARGLRTIFLSAQDEIVARVYRRVGFQPVGTAAIAAWIG